MIGRSPRRLAITRMQVAVGIVSVSAGCEPEGSHLRAPDAGSHAATAVHVDASHSDASVRDAASAPTPTSPTGTIEGAVFLDAPIRRAPPIRVPPTWASHVGCRDAALRYAQPFDITQPGVFPGALVSAEARQASPPPAIERRVIFRDCDIMPRVLFATTRDRVMFHSDTRQQHLPHVIGGGAAIDQVLIPGMSDVEIHLPGPGRFPVTVRNLPDFVGSVLFVLPNRFVDTTDGQGHYRITNVPVGNVLVHAWYPGTVEAREVVAVTANGIGHADFHLHQAPPSAPTPTVDAGPVPP